MAGDFNLLFDWKLDAQAGNPTTKKKSLAKLIELKESYDLCDIWTVRNMKYRQFIFTQQQSSDPSPVIFSLSKGNNCLIGKGFWKFNSSFTKEQNYITEIKKLICSFCTTNESLYNRQLKWELWKYEVWKFTFN